MVSVTSSHLRFRHIAKELFLKKQLFPDRNIYEIKRDSGLMKSFLDGMLNDSNKIIKETDPQIYIHMLAWNMFDIGVFTADMLFRENCSIYDIKKEYIETRINEYLKREYILRTVEAINNGCDNVQEEQLVELIKEYCRAVAENGALEFDNIESITSFTTMAYFIGASIYMQSREHDEIYMERLNFFDCY